MLSFKSTGLNVGEYTWNTNHFRLSGIDTEMPFQS